MLPGNIRVATTSGVSMGHYFLSLISEPWVNFPTSVSWYSRDSSLLVCSDCCQALSSELRNNEESSSRHNNSTGRCLRLSAPTLWLTFLEQAYCSSITYTGPCFVQCKRLGNDAGGHL